jgi:hypothetical protein
MAWWNPFKKDKRGTDPFLMAGFPLLRLFEKKKPFYEWNTSIQVPARLEGIADVSVWGYQLFVYSLLIRQKFGEEVAKIVRSHMILILDRDKGAKLGRYFEELFEVIERGVAASANTPTIETKDGTKIPVPAEIAIALAILAQMPDSPFFSNDAKKLSTFTNEEDNVLADCLILGENAAIEEFSEFVEKLELNPESVKHLRIGS